MPALCAGRLSLSLWRICASAQLRCCTRHRALLAQATRLQKPGLSQRPLRRHPRAAQVRVGRHALYLARRKGTVAACIKYLEASGYECAQCQFLAVEPFTSCPFCGSKDVVQNQDLVNSAILKALQNNIAVNVYAITRNWMTPVGLRAYCVTSVQKL